MAPTLTTDREQGDYHISAVVYAALLGVGIVMSIIHQDILALVPASMAAVGVAICVNLMFTFNRRASAMYLAL